MDLLDLQRAIDRIVENRLKAAYDEGKFKNLPGRGRPLTDINEPFNEYWWVRKWIERERLKESQLQRKRGYALKRRQGKTTSQKFPPRS